MSKANQILFPDDYKLGWLFQDDNEGYWLIWGSSKDYDTALSCAKDTINKQDENKITVFVSDIP